MSAAANRFRDRLDPELRPVDLLVERWVDETAPRRPIAANAIARAMAEAEGAALPGGDEVPLSEASALIDRIIARAPSRTRTLLEIWYRSPAPAEVKAHRVGLSRSTIYTHVNAALWYVRGAIREAGIDLSRFTMY